ncbi:hypothetical protein GCM10010412_097670 [Nonomuraea recticatena]|uniref:PIN domain-containing protein n=1 Tax=Nonomuraea recticatena TaxID=46178 RepID=A0ABN3TFE0_9ACTN
MIGRVLDSTALIAWSRRTSPYIDAAIWSRAGHTDYIVPIVTTAPALTAALAQLPDSAVPVLESLLRMDDVALVDSLTQGSAPGVDEILRAVGPYAEQAVTAASVVHAARRRGLPVLTANPFPLQQLWSGVEVDLIP